MIVLHVKVTLGWHFEAIPRLFFSDEGRNPTSPTKRAQISSLSLTPMHNICTCIRPSSLSIDLRIYPLSMALLIAPSSSPYRYSYHVHYVIAKD